MTKSVSSAERFHNLRFERTVLLSCTRSSRRSKVQSAAGQESRYLLGDNPYRGSSGFGVSPIIGDLATS